MQPAVSRLAKSMYGTWLAPFLAIVGLVLLLITGALGGTIVYGPNLDPFTGFIYSLFKR